MIPGMAYWGQRVKEKDGREGIWAYREIRVDWDGLERFRCSFRAVRKYEVNYNWLKTFSCHTLCILRAHTHTELKWSLPFCLFHWRRSIAILLTRGLRVENLLCLCGSDSSRFALIQFAVPSCGARRTERLISRRSHSSITNARRKNGKHAPNVQSPSHVCPASRRFGSVKVGLESRFKLIKEKKKMCENVVKKEGREPSLSVDVFTRWAAVGLENTNNEHGIVHWTE